MAATKLPARTKTTALVPSAQVQAAYDVKLTPEAAAKLASIKEYADYAREQTEVASRVSVVDEASNARAAELTINLTKARKGLEELQGFFSKPLNDRKTLVLGVFKRLIADPQGQEDRLRQEMGAWWQKNENERLDKEAKAKAAREKQERDAAKLGRSAPKFVAPPPQPEPVKTVHTENGQSNVKLVWDYEEQDVQKVPPQYLKPREVAASAVRAAIADGVREIAGLRIYQKPQVAVK